jgi:hypothetical protein
MKYLKMFESHNEYYTEITVDEFEIGVGVDKFISMSSNDVIRMERMLSDLCSVGISSIRMGEGDHVFRKLYMSLCDKSKPGPIIIDIRQVVDEWYYLHFYNHHNSINRFYKCDQFEGLMKCLGDII